MKKKILLFLPTLFLCLVSAYIFLAGIYGHGWNRTHLLIAFVVSIFLNFLYYLWLTTTKRLGTKLTVLYIPIAFVLFVVFIFSIMNRFWIIREVSFNMGPDPFSPGTTITSHTNFAIWQKEYWLKSAQEEYRQDHFAHMQTTRQGSLIGHVGTDLQGWSDEKIKTAFGEPAKIIKVDESLEKWIYHPWTNHPNWEMPVYVQNGTLLKIGD